MQEKYLLPWDKLHINRVESKTGNNWKLEINSEIKEIWEIIKFENWTFINKILNIFERNWTEYIETENSVYEVVKFNPSLEIAQKNILRKFWNILWYETFDYKNVSSITTAKWSTYKYLDDWRTQRYKLAEKWEDKLKEPMDILVYIHFEDDEQRLLFLWVLHHMNKDYLRIHLINKHWKKIKKIQDYTDWEELNLIVYDIQKKETISSVFATINPTIWFNTFDSKNYSENGKNMKDIHIWNKVINVILKNS